MGLSLVEKTVCRQGSLQLLESPTVAVLVENLKNNFFLVFGRSKCSCLALETQRPSCFFDLRTGRAGLLAVIFAFKKKRHVNFGRK